MYLVMLPGHSESEQWELGKKVSSFKDDCLTGVFILKKIPSFGKALEFGDSNSPKWTEWFDISCWQLFGITY